MLYQHNKSIQWRYGYGFTVLCFDKYKIWSAQQQQQQQQREKKTKTAQNTKIIVKTINKWMLGLLHREREHNYQSANEMDRERLSLYTFKRIWSVAYYSTHDYFIWHFWMQLQQMFTRRYSIVNKKK